MNEQVFISYSRKDTDWALRIKNTLESNGISCWMDQSGINAGERYTRKIVEAIRQCDIFLLILSENAEASQWVPKELGKAIQYRKYIIPVKISDFEVEEFELQLENIQIFELENLTEIQSQITLVNTIKTVLKLKPADRPAEPSSESPEFGPARPASQTGQTRPGPDDNAAAGRPGRPPEASSFRLNRPETSSSRLNRPETSSSRSNRPEAPSSRSNRPGTSSSRSGEPSPTRPEIKLPAMTADFKKKLVTAAAVILVLAVGGFSVRLFKKPSGDSQAGAVSAETAGGRSGAGSGSGVNGDSSGRSGASSGSGAGLNGGSDAASGVNDNSGANSGAGPNGGSGGGSNNPSSDHRPEGSLSDGAVQLCSLHIMNSVNSEIKEDVVNSAGQSFDQAVWAIGNYMENYATFYLGGSYDRFTGTVSCPDDLTNTDSYTFMVFLDDDKKKPAVELSISRSTPPTLLDIDTTGHETITFWVSRTNRDTGFVISDGWLYESGGQVSQSLSVDNTVPSEDTHLTSQHMMNFSGAEILEDVTNSAGQTFDKALQAVGHYQESYATFYLGGNYSRFMGTVSCPDDLNNTDSYTFMVFLDDDKKKPAAELSMSRSTPPTLLDIDVTGHETITFWADRDNRDTGFVISDGQFYTDSDPAPNQVLDTSTWAEDTLLTSQHLMKSQNASIQEDAANSAGQTFDKAVVAISAYNDNLAAFYLGQNFTRFIGTVSCPDDIPHGESYRFAVFFDDDAKHPAVEFTMSRSTPPTLLDIDVTGHDTITFWADKKNRETGFLISAGQLYRPGDQIPDSPTVDTTVASDDSLLTSQHLMKPVNASIQEDAVNSAGQIFDKAVVAVAPYSDNLASFYLGQNFTRFIGTVSCPDDISHAENYQFMVFLDDDSEHPVTEFTMSRSTPPTLLDIDVTGHDTITFWAARDNRETGFLISAGQLYGPGDQVPDAPAVDTTVTAPDTLLTSQHLMKSVNASIQEDAMNSAGQTFDKAVMAVGSYTENLAAFYLGQNYSRFTGTVSCPEQISHTGDYQFMIFLDDNKKEPAVEFTMNRGSSPVPVNIDLTGHETITFWTSRGNNDTGFLISDGQLTP